LKHEHHYIGPASGSLVWYHIIAIRPKTRRTARTTASQTYHALRRLSELYSPEASVPLFAVALFKVEFRLVELELVLFDVAFSYLNEMSKMNSPNCPYYFIS